MREQATFIEHFGNNKLVKVCKLYAHVVLSRLMEHFTEENNGDSTV